MKKIVTKNVPGLLPMIEAVSSAVWYGTKEKPTISPDLGVREYIHLEPIGISHGSQTALSCEVSALEFLNECAKRFPIKRNLCVIEVEGDGVNAVAICSKHPGEQNVCTYYNNIHEGVTGTCCKHYQYGPTCTFTPAIIDAARRKS